LSGADLAGLGGWPAVLGPLTAGQDLLASDARAAMLEILSGEATPAQIAGFIVALRMKGETVDELVGLLDAMGEVGERVLLPDLDDVLDVVGTGGDRRHTVNISTMAALTAAGAGVRVCKHGNRAASSRCGTADVLEALGVRLELGPAEVAACVADAGIGFCFAPRFHPAMRHAGPTRKELGVPTVFNFLGPLANPAGVRRQLVGVADAGMAERVARVLVARGSIRALVAFGDDGLDELTTTTTSTIVEIVEGEVHRRVVDPGELGIHRAAPADLEGGDAGENAEIVRRYLAGEPGPVRDIALLNAAAGLMAAGRADDLAAGFELGRDAVDSGRAAAALDALVAVSNR
jgi:anthranilate phosphoribosyltransferase